MREVVFFGKKATLMLGNMSVSQGGWHGALSKKSIICLFFRLFNLVRIVTIISVLIHAFSLLKYWAPQGCDGFAKRAKHCGNLLLPITIRPSFSPSAFTKNAAIFFCFAFLPPLQLFPFEIAISQALPSRSSHCRRHSTHA